MTGAPPSGSPRRRLWIFRGVTIVAVPALLLAVLEAGLRIGGFGYPPAVTVPCERAGVVCRGDNVKFAWRFFPPPIAQEFDPFIFAVAKPTGTYRIFVLGASAAQGTPDPAYSFGRIVEVLLDSACPEIDFEVVVAAMPAINSHVVVEIARDLAKYDPDLFVVYLGNNEVVGPYGPGTVFAPLSPSRPLIRAGIRLRATKTGQLLAAVASRLGSDARVPKVWEGLEMFQNQRVTADDPRLRTVCNHFRKNLEQIRRTALDSGAEVLFCTVGGNLRDCPPFASVHRPDLTEGARARWDALYEAGVRQEGQEDYAAAIESYLAAAAIDGCYADLQFRLGRCYRLAGDAVQAGERYVRARELDALRFRPDGQINATIRQVVEVNDPRVRLVDAEEVFRRASPAGLPGRELFHEHVHLTFRGNYLLARAVCEQVPPAAGRMLLEESVCRDRMAYNAWAHYNTLFKVLNYYLRKPPFTNQLYHDEWVAEQERAVSGLEAALTPQVEQQMGSAYRERIAAQPEDIWLRLRFAEFGSTRLKDEQIAVEQCRQVAQLVPHSYKPRLLLALSLGNQQRFAEALEPLRSVVQLKPTSAQGFYLLGTALQAVGRLDEAVDAYARAVRLRPDNRDACERIRRILLSQGKTEQARRWDHRVAGQEVAGR